MTKNTVTKLLVAIVVVLTVLATWITSDRSRMSNVTRESEMPSLPPTRSPREQVKKNEAVRATDRVPLYQAGPDGITFSEPRPDTIDNILEVIDYISVAGDVEQPATLKRLTATITRFEGDGSKGETQITNDIGVGMDGAFRAEIPLTFGRGVYKVRIRGTHQYSTDDFAAYDTLIFFIRNQ